MDYNNFGRRDYNEKEIGELIQRATELHEKATGTSERKLSLSEIEQIASELGLSPEHLQAAALEMDGKVTPDKSFSLWGAPFVVDETRIVNKTLTEEEWEDIVFELRKFTGRTGKTSDLGQSRQWSHYIGEGEEGINFTKMQVSARAKSGQTSIQIQKHYGILAALYPAAFLVSTIIALAIINDVPNPAFELLLPGGILGSFALVRGLIAKRSKQYRNKLSWLADQFQDMLSASRSSVPVAEARQSDELVSQSERSDEIPVEHEEGWDLLEIPEQDESEAEETDSGSTSKTRSPETRA